jgi:hypothetical protein
MSKGRAGGGIRVATNGRNEVIAPRTGALHPARNRRPMPFKSQAQRRKFAQLLVEGKISNQTFEEWNRETGGKKLPERVSSKSRSRKPGSSTRKRRTAAKR